MRPPKSRQMLVSRPSRAYAARLEQRCSAQRLISALEASRLRAWQCASVGANACMQSAVRDTWEGQRRAGPPGAVEDGQPGVLDVPVQVLAAGRHRDLIRRPHTMQQPQDGLRAHARAGTVDSCVQACG